MKDEKNYLSALKPLVHDKQKYDALTDYVDFLIEKQRKQLERLTDPIEIYKAQGHILALRGVQRLRNTVTEMDK